MEAPKLSRISLSSVTLLLLLFFRFVVVNSLPYCQGICSLASSSSVGQAPTEEASKLGIGVGYWNEDDVSDLFTREVVQDDATGVTVLERKPVLQKDHGKLRELAVVGDTSDWERLSERVYPFSSMGQIRFLEDGFHYVCSGTLIAANVVLTSAHCALNSTYNLLSDIEYFPNKVGDVIFERVSVVGGFAFFGEEAYRYPGRAYIPERDWIILFLNRNIGEKYGWLEVSPVSLHYPDEITVYGYSTHEHCQYTRYLCAGTGIVESSGNSLEYHYKVDTAQGSSGGAVTGRYDSETNNILYGVHRGIGVHGEYNVAVPSPVFHDYIHQFLTLQNYNLEANVVSGIICHRHEHCSFMGIRSFCSRENRCVVCDFCFGSEASNGTIIDPIDENCPEYCINNPKKCNYRLEYNS